MSPPYYMNVLVPRTGTGSKAFPAILQRAGTAACFAAAEFFAAKISNPHTRRAYARPVGRFLTWCEAHGIELRPAWKPSKKSCGAIPWPFTWPRMHHLPWSRSSAQRWKQRGKERQKGLYWEFIQKLEGAHGPRARGFRVALLPGPI